MSVVLKDALLLPIDQIEPSRSNPRTKMEKEKLKELAADIAANGVLQPVLVRPHPRTGEGKEDSWQLVFGHRRLKAAKMAQLTNIPAIVRDLEDVEVLQLQLVENMQRADLHPLEEADAYKRLMEEYGMGVHHIAAKVSKSETYVHQRLKLADLGKPIRDELWAGNLTAGVAEALARIPDEALQTKALEEVKGGGDGGGAGIYDEPPMSEKEARQHIRTRYMLALKDAPFPTGDPTLVSEAGSCTNCSKKVGNVPTLFPDVDRKETCTDPGCFATKRTALLMVREKELLGKHKKVLGLEESRKLLRNGIGGFADNSKLVPLANNPWQDKKHRTWTSLLGKDKPEIVHAIDDAGKVHQLVARKEALGVLAKRGTAWAKTALGQRAKSSRRKKAAAPTKTPAERALATKVLKRTSNLLLGELVASVSPTPPGAVYDEYLQTLGAALLGGRTYYDGRLNDAARVLICKANRAAIQSTLKKTGKGEDWQRTQVALLVLAIGPPKHQYGNSIEPEWSRIAKHYGIFMAKVKAKATATKELAPKAKKVAKKKAKKAAGKKFPSKKVQAAAAKKKKAAAKRRDKKEKKHGAPARVHA